MKLTSKSLKIGDKIIRKSPVVNDSSYTTDICTIVQKHTYHTVVSIPHVNKLVILPHYKWNDNEWVKIKTFSNE